MTQTKPTNMPTAPWPPSCRSAPSNCTCCCILTPHTHLADPSGYPHLNHIIRFPQADTKQELLAWFHCPHCPCMLGLQWVHPNEMSVVEENVSAASWLPRVNDFEAYSPLLEEGGGMATSDCGSPMVGTPTHSVLVDLVNGTNVPENCPSTPVLHRKPPIDTTRKSTRKTKLAPRAETSTENSFETPPYKPRRSKYDVR